MSDIKDRLNSLLVDRYRILRELGAGGMATVYLAEDLRHHRQVAIKVLHPELAAILGAERFLSEIRTTASLQHPQILPLHDSGEAGGLLFYVMPLVDGETLRERLRREQQLPIDEAVRIARDIAGALDYAHRRGVIHRDIKPDNIFLHEGQALIADFGIALAITSAGGERMTQTGISLGTPEYMSPEQALGQRSITAKADVYALGCVLYETLTGQPPVTGPTAQAIVAKILQDRPPVPSTLRETVPAALDEVVMSALAKLPADRIPSAAAFREALTSAVFPGTATTALRLGQPGTRGTTRRWQVVSAVLAVVALAGWIRAGVRPRASAADKAALSDLHDQFTRAQNAGDAAIVEQTDASDVVILPPNGTLIAGRDAHMRLNRESYNKFTMIFDNKSAEIVTSGDWGFDRGTYRYSETPRAGGATVVTEGNYLWLARREQDGKWRYARIIWNITQPPPAEDAPR